MDNRIDAIYGRQSIDKKDSISIESQFEFCRYELKGGEAKEYKDKGYSGKNIERPDFQRLLRDIRAGLIRRVIVYKLDRISRSIVDFAKLMELFKQYNVEFVSCTEKFDTSTPMGRAMLNICIVFAQLERESIQMRVQDAFYSGVPKATICGAGLHTVLIRSPSLWTVSKQSGWLKMPRWTMPSLCMKCTPSRRTPTATLPGILPRMKSWCMERH